MSHWSVRLSNVLFVFVMIWVGTRLFDSDLTTILKNLDRASSQFFSETGAFGKIFWLLIFNGTFSFVLSLGFCLPLLVSSVVVYIRDYNCLGGFKEYAVDRLMKIAYAFVIMVVMGSVICFLKQIGEERFNTNFIPQTILLLVGWGIAFCDRDNTLENF
jgi:hypothetical protein